MFGAEHGQLGRAMQLTAGRSRSASTSSSSPLPREQEAKIRADAGLRPLAATPPPPSSHAASTPKLVRRLSLAVADPATRSQLCDANKLPPADGPEFRRMLVRQHASLLAQRRSLATVERANRARLQLENALGESELGMARTMGESRFKPLSDLGAAMRRIEGARRAMLGPGSAAMAPWRVICNHANRPEGDTRTGVVSPERASTRNDGAKVQLGFEALEGASAAWERELLQATARPPSSSTSAAAAQFSGARAARIELDVLRFDLQAFHENVQRLGQQRATEAATSSFFGLYAFHTHAAQILEELLPAMDGARRDAMEEKERERVRAVAEQKDYRSALQSGELWDGLYNRRPPTSPMAASTPDAAVGATKLQGGGMSGILMVQRKAGKPFSCCWANLQPSQPGHGAVLVVDPTWRTFSHSKFGGSGSGSDSGSARDVITLPLRSSRLVSEDAVLSSRPWVFEVEGATPRGKPVRYAFQAPSEASRAEWVQGLQQQQVESMKQAAAGAGGGGLLDERVEDIRGRDGNDRCADCGDDAPSWAALRYGSLVCEQCAIAHKQLALGDDSSTSGPFSVQPLVGSSLDWLTPALCALLLGVGNAATNGAFVSSFPHVKRCDPDATLPQRAEFLSTKYAQRQFVAGAGEADGAGEGAAPRDSNALVRAAHCGSLGAALGEIAHGVGIDAEDSSGQPALHAAAAAGHNALIELLIFNGADLYSGNVRGESALHSAVDGGNVEACALLLDLDAMESVGNKTLLLRASRDGTTAQELARRKARDGVAEADGMNSLFKLVDD